MMFFKKWKEIKEYKSVLANALIETSKNGEYPALVTIHNGRVYGFKKEAPKLVKKLVNEVKKELDASLGLETILASEMGDIGEKLVDSNNNFKKNEYERDLLALVSNPYFLFGGFDIALLMYFPKKYKLPQETLKTFCVKLAFEGKKYCDSLQK